MPTSLYSVTKKICSSMSFRTLTSFNPNLLKFMRLRPMITPVQSLVGIRQRCPVLLKDPKCKPLCWVGVFGSFTRNEQTRTSRIDMIFGYRPDVDELSWDREIASERFANRAPKVFGRKVNVLDLDTQEVGGYDILEALLTCVTVYGPEDWHHCARVKARSMLDEGYRRLRKAYDIMSQIEHEMTNKNVSNFLMFTK
jgi:predicted nucleotidyltransferase